MTSVGSIRVGRRMLNPARAGGARRRPRALATTTSAAIAMFVGIACLLGSGCARSGGPSVVLVVIDTLRADHVGVLGAGEGRTPVLDALAEGGVVFERCYSQYPLTLPSIATLLASQWPHVHRVRENYDERLSDDATTLAEVFAAAGYRTGAFVSALPVREETGCAQGFDRYDDDFSERFVFHSERLKPLEEKWTGSERRGDLTIARALEWLEDTTEPYFLFVHLFDPHSPYDAPEPFASSHPTPYAAEVAYADALVGRLLEAMSDRGTPAPVVAVVSDHGEGLGEHGEWAHGIFLYDATLHVPWILSAPDTLAARRVTSDVRLVDVAPTLLDLAGLESPPVWAGRSCLPLALGEAEPPRPVYAENYFTRSEYGWSELEAFMSPAWKWIRAPRPELYDRRDDPGELRDLALEEPEVARDLDDRLSRFARSSAARAESLGVHDLVETIEPEARVLDWLRSLGYLSGDDVAREEARELPDPKDRIEEWNDRNDAHTHAGRGFALLDAGRPGIALQAFEAAIGYFPSAEALTGLGLTLLELESPARAESALARAVALEPRNVDALVGQARALVSLGRHVAADSVLTRACLVDTARVDAIALRARTRDRLDRPEEALADYERLLRLAPSDVDARLRAGELAAAGGEWRRARDHLESLAAEREWDPVVLWRLGETRARTGDTGGAIEALRDARERAGPGAIRDSIDEALSELSGR
jgi:arylsulfatase A-like enzyme/Flp pilus assembly protein TadD